jgi:hypothetical protein
MVGLVGFDDSLVLTSALYDFTVNYYDVLSKLLWLPNKLMWQMAMTALEHGFDEPYITLR